MNRTKERVLIGVCIFVYALAAWAIITPQPIDTNYHFWFVVMATVCVLLAITAPKRLVMAGAWIGVTAFAGLAVICAIGTPAVMFDWQLTPGGLGGCIIRMLLLAGIATQVARSPYSDLEHKATLVRVIGFLPILVGVWSII